MKYLIFLFSILFLLPLNAQYTQEQCALLGIAPRQNKKNGKCYNSYYNTMFNDTICYYSSIYSKVNFNENNKIIPNINFLFYNNKISVSNLSNNDPKNNITILGKIKSQTINNYVINVYQCKDNANAFMCFTTIFKSDTSDVAFEIAYNNTKYYYEVQKQSIPKIIQNSIIEQPGYVGDDKFGSNYTYDEIDEFLSQFGDTQVILNFMLHSMLYDLNDTKKDN